MKVVISGVNLINGGPLKVYKDAIVSFLKIEEVDLICLVNNKNLFKDLDGASIKFIEFKYIKKSWLFRIFFEYFYSYILSKKLKPDIWLSMHDISPFLSCKNQYVYCHNPSPFYKTQFNDLLYDFKFFLFTLFYKYLYRVNIKSNTAVITQQRWIASYMKKNYGVDTIVSSPINEEEDCNLSIKASTKRTSQDNNKIVLFYPALVRTFKNFELLLSAFNYLSINQPHIYDSLHLNLTIGDGKSFYESVLLKKYQHLKNVSFKGMLNRDQINHEYSNCDIVVFPSKLETWGLPITEAKAFNKPIILADLDYAKETLNTYDRVKFVNVNDSIHLASVLEDVVNKKEVFKKFTFIKDNSKNYESWDELSSFICASSK